MNNSDDTYVKLKKQIGIYGDSPELPKTETMEYNPKSPYAISKISNEMYILGSGGANDAANAQEVVLVVAARKGRFMEKLPFITFPGKNVTALVSTEVVLKKLSPDGELTLTAVLPSPEPLTKEERILRAKEGFGWDLKIAPTVVEKDAARWEELLLVRALDSE